MSLCMGPGEHQPHFGGKIGGSGGEGRGGGGRGRGRGSFSLLLLQILFQEAQIVRVSI